MNKRGQLFILSAVTIALALVTITTVFNYALVENEPSNVYDLSSNIKKEGFEVIDYGIYNSVDLKSLMSAYTNNLSDYIINTEPDAEFFFIYGNSSIVRVEDFSRPEILNTISIQVGGTSFVRDTNKIIEKAYRNIYYTESVPDDSNKINITINNQLYPITINPGQNFIILMKKTYKNNTFLYLR
jgi:hypothetical protein